MTPTTLAERIADCHSARARAKRLGLTAAGLGAVAGAIAALFIPGGAAGAVAATLAASVLAALPFALRGWSARRRLARLETDHPEIFPTAMERYRMVMATERASRYKLFC